MSHADAPVSVTVWPQLRRLSASQERLRTPYLEWERWGSRYRRILSRVRRTSADSLAWIGQTHTRSTHRAQRSRPVCRASSDRASHDMFDHRRAHAIRHVWTRLWKSVDRLGLGQPIATSDLRLHELYSNPGIFSVIEFRRLLLVINSKLDSQ